MAVAARPVQRTAPGVAAAPRLQIRRIDTGLFHEEPHDAEVAAAGGPQKRRGSIAVALVGIPLPLCGERPQRGEVAGLCRAEGATQRSPRLLCGRQRRLHGCGVPGVPARSGVVELDRFGRPRRRLLCIHHRRQVRLHDVPPEPRFTLGEAAARAAEQEPSGGGAEIRASAHHDDRAFGAAVVAVVHAGEQARDDSGVHGLHDALRKPLEVDVRGGALGRGYGDQVGAGAWAGLRASARARAARPRPLALAPGPQAPEDEARRLALQVRHRGARLRQVGWAEAHGRLGVLEHAEALRADLGHCGAHQLRHLAQKRVGRRGGGHGGHVSVSVSALSLSLSLSLSLLGRQNTRTHPRNTRARTPCSTCLGLGVRG
mmetsp:Transcript_23021/g.71616  ORF Transcript_23021/g.71616 Transcript_23021/m.71616 type:complete len:373 (-) Transcript_23021:50-1168(-)